MHKFTMNFKVDSVANELATVQGIAQAVAACNELGLKKIYLESYRNKLDIPLEHLQKVKNAFVEAGFEVGCVIVPTKMSDRIAQCWDSVTCFSDPSAKEYLKKVVERSAQVFDTILFDDFLFTSCCCEVCVKERGERSWGEYRCELLQRVIHEAIIEPAKRVNKNVKLIIKYPCWYENFYAQGYDLFEDTRIFDLIWSGNETRNENIPQAQAYWIGSYLAKLGKPCGSWYDPLSCPPEIFVEQARNTILTKTAESLLHCYDYLYLGATAFAQDGGSLTVNKDRGCIDALKHELPRLNQLAELISDVEPYGVYTYRKPNSDAVYEGNMLPYFNMLGIPVTAEIHMNKLGPAIFTGHAASFAETAAHIEQLDAQAIPYLMSNIGHKIFGKPFDFSHVFYKSSYNELYEVENLDAMRNYVLSYFNIEFFAPAKVSLLCYKSDNGVKKLEVIQNFNRHAVKCQIKCDGRRKKLLSIPADDSGSIDDNGNISLAAGSLLVIGNV